MFIEPIVVPKTRAFEPTAASRMLGFLMFPLSLVIMALWLSIGAVYAGGVLATHFVRKMSRTLLAAVDYAGMVAVGR